MLNDEEACQYRLKSFGHPATQHKYIIDGDKQITAVDYFNDIWKFPLRYPHLPVVELYHSSDNNMLYALPMELVAVDKGQPNLQAITSEQHTKATRKTLIRPDKYYRMMKRVVDELLAVSRPCLSLSVSLFIIVMCFSLFLSSTFHRIYVCVCVYVFSSFWL